MIIMTEENENPNTKSKFDFTVEKWDQFIENSERMQKLMIVGIITIAFLVGSVVGMLISTSIFDNLVIRPLQNRITALNNYIERYETDNLNSSFPEGLSSILQ